MEIRELGGPDGVYCTLDTLEGSACFGHWVIECAWLLPHIADLRKNRFPGLKILLNCKRRYKLLFLKDFGFQESDIVYGSHFTDTPMYRCCDHYGNHRYVIPEPDSCTTLIIPPFTYPSHIVRGNAIDGAYRTLRDIYDGPSVRGDVDVVYMTRSLKENFQHNRRTFVNHAEILQILGDLDVRIVQVDDLQSFHEQAALVRTAKVLIIEHGSALTNAWLFAKNCHVLVLNRWVFCRHHDWIDDMIIERNNTMETIPITGDSGAFHINPTLLIERILHAGGRLPEKSMNHYVTQLVRAGPSIETVVQDVASHLSLLPTVYLSGIGKSGLVARKSASTWQSLGLPAHYILAPDMLHGDIGVLRPGDVVLYISNSGNTEELLQITSHLKLNKPGVIQILVSNNATPKVAASVDHSFMIGDTSFIEADVAQCAPTVSSVLFMIFLDLLGIRVAAALGGSKETFKTNHPSGELGKK